MRESRTVASRPPLRMDGQHKASTAGSWPSPDTVLTPDDLNDVPQTLRLPAPKLLPQRLAFRWVTGRSVCLIALLASLPCLQSLGRIAVATLGRAVHVPLGVGAAGFVAQLVDGSLGMGYGLTSTIMNAAGLDASTASSVVHLAQLGTTLVSGLAHHRAKNVNEVAMRRMACWGFTGAFVGAALLSQLSLHGAKVAAGMLLFSVGAYLLARSCSSDTQTMSHGPSVPLGHAFVAPLALLGGFVDATGGGGWGPVATSGLLARGTLSPQRVIGTVSLSEFFVTVGCVAGFVVSSFLRSGSKNTDVQQEGPQMHLVLMLLVGGLMAAPIAPALVKRVEPRTLSSVVGGFICLTNARVLLNAIDACKTLKFISFTVITCAAAVASWKARQAAASMHTSQ